MLIDYFTKLIQANNDTVPDVITDLYFVCNWSQQDKLRMANIKNTHLRVTNSSGIKFEIEEVKTTSTFKLA